MNCAGCSSGGRSPRRSVVFGNTTPYSTFSAGQLRRRRPQPVPQRVGVLAGLDMRLDGEMTAVRHELPVAQLDPVALHLDHRDALARVGEHDVDLVITPIRRQRHIGEHQPVVAQVVTQRLDDRPFLVVGERPQREVVRHEESQRPSLAGGSGRETLCLADVTAKSG